MGDDLNLSKPLTQLLSSSSSSSSSSSPELAPPQPPPPPPHPSNMPFFYYGLVVVATAAIVLAVYNLIIVRWCTTQYRRSRESNDHLLRHRRNNIVLSRPPASLSRNHLPSSFKYKKGIEDANKNQMDFDIECSVCLSVFEDGEEMRNLPRCNHSFHASCIDMWLYSHSDCPLCRALVVEPTSPPQHRQTDSSV